MSTTPIPAGNRSRVLGLVILFGAACAFAGLLRSSSEPAPRAGTDDPPAAIIGAKPGGPQPNTGPVEQRLLADIGSLQGAYGVAVIDLSSGSIYGVNGNRVFRAASVNKIPIILTLYDRASSGHLSLDQTLTIGDSDIQHYGTGTIQNSDGPRTYTLRQLGDLTIQVSDNTAAYVLERFLGQQAIQQNLSRWHLDHTSMSDNTTTPADAGTLMAELYTGKLLPPDATQMVLGLLKSSVFTDRLAAGVPAGVPVAHKVGTDVGVYNDAGVVMLPQRAYAISILSEDADENEAITAFAQISRDVYGFESSLVAGSQR